MCAVGRPHSGAHAGSRVRSRPSAFSWACGLRADAAASTALVSRCVALVSRRHSVAARSHVGKMKMHTFMATCIPVCMNAHMGAGIHISTHFEHLQKTKNNLYNNN